MKRSQPLRRSTPLRATKGLESHTPLERGAPLQSRSELKRVTELQRTTKLKPRSEERQRFMDEERKPMIEAMVAEGRKCEIGPVLIKHGLDGAKTCIGRIEGLHELRKRSAGGSLRNPSNLMPACNPCNGWVEDHPDESHILGLVIREGDEGWDALGIRHDREECPDEQGDDSGPSSRDGGSGRGDGEG